MSLCFKCGNYIFEKNRGEYKLCEKCMCEQIAYGAEINEKRFIIISKHGEHVLRYSSEKDVEETAKDLSSVYGTVLICEILKELKV
jgi:hypothetical protein